MELGTVSIIGVIVLGLALAWGMFQNRSRNKSLDKVTEAATRDLYDGGPASKEPRRDS